MKSYKPTVTVDTSAIVAILTGSNFFVSSDKHHVKKSLKERIENKGVKVFTLSEIERIKGKF